MTLGDALALELPFLRAQAESRMGAENGGSTATVKRPGGPPVIVDGLATPGWTTVAASLPGRLTGSRNAASSRTVTIGQTEVQLAVREWHCPADTTGLRDGDIIGITAGENAGVFLRVVESAWQDQATARRLPVVEVQEPEGWSS